MNRDEAEQQARVWAHWTGEKTQAATLYGTSWWERTVITGEGHTYSHDGGDLRAGASPDLRRAIEAKAAYVSLIYMQPPNDAAKAEAWGVLIEVNGNNFAGVGPTLEQALFLAAKAAAESNDA